MDFKDDMVTLKESAIEDFFYYEDEKIVILNNELFKKVPEDALIFAKLVLDENGDELIEPIEDEEYDKIYKTYKKLLKAVSEEEDDNDKL